MFARITHYKMKPESIETATAQLEQMKPQIMALPGLRQFLNAIGMSAFGRPHGPVGDLA